MTGEINLNEEVKTSEITTETTPIAWTSLENYIVTNKDKIQNASVINLDKMSIPKGKYFLFKTNHPTDSELVLFKQPSTLWIQNIPAAEIKIKDSGIVIKTDNQRIYAGKNNIVNVSINSEGKVEKISTVSRAKTIKNIKEGIENIQKNEVDIDTSKLYIKKASPRLYSKIKDMSDKNEIKKTIISYMNNIEDINHLIKLESELLCACQL